MTVIGNMQHEEDPCRMMTVIGNMKKIRVLVRKEHAGSTWAYVAIGLEEFVAYQGTANAENWSDVVNGLGDMFDWRDHWEQDENVMKVPPAPDDVVADWEAATPIGTRQLGVSRVAELRMGASYEWKSLSPSSREGNC